MGPALRELEQVPCNGVDRGSEEANDQPLHWVYPAQAFGKRPRQAEGWSAGGLNRPQNTKYGEDHQTDQCKRVEYEGRLNVAMEQRVTHPRPPAQRAVPTGQKTERTGQPESGRRVQRAESESACKDGANVPGCTSGRKGPDLSGDRHIHIVPAFVRSTSLASVSLPGSRRLHSPRHS
jgi:hypothetical protein